MATTSIAVEETPLVLQLLRRADDALILGHRVSEWTGHAPTLEEELALATIALDLIGQARTLYDHAGELFATDAAGTAMVEAREFPIRYYYELHGTPRSTRRWRAPYRTSRPPARGDAISPTHLSGCDMVDAAALRDRALAALAEVTDPEILVLMIADLGILRDVTVRGDTVEVTITPTYTGCPAMTFITLEIETSLVRAGVKARVRTTLSPAWTTDWLSEAARRKLAAFGIAPPEHTASRRALFGEARPACPRCGGEDTEQISEFGSTACKSRHRCRACREPFDAFKCHWFRMADPW